MENWSIIKTEDDIRQIIDKSNNYPQIIFKDSISCGISAYAKERLMQESDLLTSKADFYYLDLLRYRAISNFIARELNVHHQSPQVIVVKNGVATYSATHHNIDANTIANNL
jgi:bacillithiol system protein YtxJ